jgi:cell wall-associated NlpC family hydrolase
LAKDLWIAATLKRLGAPNTARNRAYLRSQQRWEGGHTHNTARFNWLNTSRSGYGGRSANISVAPHIKRYPGFEQGVAATADTIRSGYPSVLAALRSGNIDARSPGVASDLRKWVSGSRAMNSKTQAYANRVASSMGDVPAATAAELATTSKSRTPPADISATLVQPGTRKVPQIDVSTVVGSLMRGVNSGDFMSFFHNLYTYKNPLLVPRPRIETIKPTLVPTRRGTKRNPNISVDIPGGEPVTPNVAPIIRLAKQYLGTPYKWGGASPRTGFDCSGLVQFLYAQRGVRLPRVSQDQAHAGRPVERHELRPGDAVFFNTEGTDTHEGLYIGNGQFLHAPHTGDVVKISSLNDPYYSSHYHVARRFL